MSSFFYRYYYVFFVQHLASFNKGKTSATPWISALIQLSAGFGLPLVSLYIVAWHKFWQPDEAPLTGKLFVPIILAGVAWGLYHLLFTYLDVSKEDGRTNKLPIVEGRSAKLFFWVFWALSCLLSIVFVVISSDKPFRWV